MIGCEALAMKQRSSMWCEATWEQDWYACGEKRREIR